jgi:hypothetical protein
MFHELLDSNARGAQYEDENQFFGYIFRLQVFCQVSTGGKKNGFLMANLIQFYSFP